MKLTQDIVDSVTFLSPTQTKEELRKRFPHSIIEVKIDKKGSRIIEVDDERAEIKVY